MSKRLGGSPKSLGRSPKELELSTQVEAKAMLWAAIPPQATDNRKSWLSRVARALGWKPRRVRAIWNCEARVITADEWRTLNQRLDALKAAERRLEEETHELREAYRAAREGRPVARGTDAHLGPEAPGSVDPRSASGGPAR